MMTSDSEESDYEDARQHHDNEVESEGEEPFAVAMRNARARGVVMDEYEIDTDSDNERNGAPNLPAIPVVGNNNENGLNQILNEQLPLPDAVNQMHMNAVNAIEVLLGGNPRLLVEEPPNLDLDVVDSDDDELEVASDGDSDMDFPLLNSGERNRGAGTSDGNDAQDAADLDEDVPEFDQELPIRHSYLGEGMEELQGRVVLEEDATPEIPLIAMGQHLIPGQTLPLQIYHVVFQNAIRRCVMGDRLFGIVHNEMNQPGSNNVIYIGALGTLAEIFEIQEDSADDLEEAGRGMFSTFAVKTKGRQRFNVVEVRRQADGNLMGKVRIRPEIRLEQFVLPLLSPATSRHFLTYPFSVEHAVNDLEGTSLPGPSSSSGTVSLPHSPRMFTRMSSADSSARLRRDSLSSVSSTMTNATSASSSNPSTVERDLKALNLKIQSQRKRLKYYSALTPHPYFVYEQYDETILVERLHRLLRTELQGVAKSRGRIPMDALDLSFWLAQNLLIDDSQRTKVLKMDCPIQRLRYYLQLLGKTTKVISCKNCETQIAEHSQIFSMSIEGPQGTYVNPHGFVHETLTVYKTRDLVTRGGPSTEASWFPGYSWTIVECRRCKAHIGWKFQAVGRLKPARFWGLARRSVISKYNFGSDSDIQESLDSYQTSPNSANSEAFQTVSLF